MRTLQAQQSFRVPLLGPLALTFVVLTAEPAAAQAEAPGSQAPVAEVPAEPSVPSDGTAPAQGAPPPKGAEAPPGDAAPTNSPTTDPSPAPVGPGPAAAAEGGSQTVGAAAGAPATGAAAASTVAPPAQNSPAVPEGVAPAQATPPAADAPAAGAKRDQAGPAASNGSSPSGAAERPPSDFLVAAMVEPSVMLGDLSEFAGSFGIAGFGVDVRYLRFSPFRLGAGISFHSVTDTRGEDTFTQGSAVYTGSMSKEISFTPILAKVGYTLGGAGKVQTPPATSGSATTGSTKPKTTKTDPTPYLAFGIGATRVARRVDLGITTITTDSWHFALVPEAGVEFSVGPVLLVGAVRLNLLLPSGGYSMQNYVNLALGVGFR